MVIKIGMDLITQEEDTEVATEEDTEDVVEVSEVDVVVIIPITSFFGGSPQHKFLNCCTCC